MVFGYNQVLLLEHKPTLCFSGCNAAEKQLVQFDTVARTYKRRPMLQLGVSC